MGRGLRVPNGLLPVYSVGSAEEADSLITMTCELSLNKQYFARELAEAQTLENLEKFSDRLDKAHGLIVEHGRCTCVTPGAPGDDMPDDREDYYNERVERMP